MGIYVIVNKFVFFSSTLYAATTSSHAAADRHIHVSGSNEQDDFLAGLTELVIFLFFNCPCRYDPLIAHCYTPNHVWSGNYLGGALMYAVDAHPVQAPIAHLLRINRHGLWPKDA